MRTHKNIERLKDKLKKKDRCLAVRKRKVKVIWDELEIGERQPGVIPTPRSEASTDKMIEHFGTGKDSEEEPMGNSDESPRDPTA